MTKELEKWADEAMFKAEPSDAAKGPEVYLLQGTPDPLGSIAAFSAMYVGKVVRDKRDVTDDERRYHLEEMKKTKLKAPLEAVNLHFMIEGVTRSFTHQMVRQRTAVYAQESLRFAVKEDASDAVALPPSLQGVDPYDGTNGDGHMGEMSQQQQWLYDWDEAVILMDQTYNLLVNSGMPAEDARGLLPHAITTRLNYATNLRNFQDHLGNRLCTQAQFEWKNVVAQMLKAIRGYCTTDHSLPFTSEAHGPEWCDNWQWREIANLFRPVCYLTGQCEFKADFDRKCSIRARVDANASIGRKSTEWDKTYGEKTFAAPGVKVEHAVHENQRDHHVTFIGAISPAEWLTDDGAAR